MMMNRLEDLWKSANDGASTPIGHAGKPVGSRDRRVARRLVPRAPEQHRIRDPAGSVVKLIKRLLCRWGRLGLRSRGGASAAQGDPPVAQGRPCRWRLIRGTTRAADRSSHRRCQGGPGVPLGELFRRHERARYLRDHRRGRQVSPRRGDRAGALHGLRPSHQRLADHLRECRPERPHRPRAVLRPPRARRRSPLPPHRRRSPTTCPPMSGRS